MSRHITDHDRTHEGDRAKAYAEIERREGVHPAVKELNKRPTGVTGEGKRVEEFARIERGEEG
ncbi:hypothetical protein [Phaeovulum vinaykumarii]|uniref:Uncharacterized protein n=1 Tax=Phaeovulum vinaykumarii TaxID=407234 RepID=A0A1N7MN28_9RHOB|nr:hypothetical protein [Phaeovulum vinaykumarii]SIS87543.1 hypothetical protein SAMN05421795_108119 [Phaeovulum vinaykumarii]SOC13093.1 hypothetical protein SAMN05878426_10827 [Phaeovulum vinaykumarii]